MRELNRPGSQAGNFARILKRVENRVRVEWDARKAAANLRKHGVSFVEASGVFVDLLSVIGNDPDHSIDQRRYVTFGVSSSGRLLVVAHAERDDAIRIISARKATRAERKLYEAG
jgi:uncharacterized protein